MILMRLMTAAVELAGGASTSCSTPSIRYRTLSRFSNGSMWMSEARASTARCMIRLTRRMTGASEARSRRCSTSSSSSSPAPRLSTICPIALRPPPNSFSMPFSISEAIPTRGEMVLPLAMVNALSANSSRGLAMTTTSSPFSEAIGRIRFCFM